MIDVLKQNLNIFFLLYNYLLLSNDVTRGNQNIY